MTEEEKNKIIRKTTPLTKEEWFNFFISSIAYKMKISPTKDFFNTEFERFKKFGFDTKHRQSKKVIFFGLLFYFILFIILLHSIS